MYSGFCVATHKLIKNSNGVIYFVIFDLYSNSFKLIDVVLFPLLSVFTTLFAITNFLSGLTENHSVISFPSESVSPIVDVPDVLSIASFIF